MDQANLPGYAIGYINFASFLIRTAVINAYKLKFAVPRVDDPYPGTKWQVRMRGGQSSRQSNRSPLAVFFPSNSGPYQLALPTQVLMGFTGSLRCATRGASMTGAMRNISSIHRMAAQARKSGRLIVCSFGYKNLKSVAYLPHYVNHFLLAILSRNSLIVNTLASVKRL